MLLHQYDKPSFIPIQNKRQNYSSVYFSVYVFGQQTVGQKILQALPEFNLLLISSYCISRLVHEIHYAALHYILHRNIYATHKHNFSKKRSVYKQRSGTHRTIQSSFRCNNSHLNSPSMLHVHGSTAMKISET